MDQDQDGTRSFPPPPPFYQHFTQSNTEQIEAVRRASQPDTSDIADDDLSNIEPHLQYLLPPKPPTVAYNAFGEQQSNDTEFPFLPDDIERLVPVDPSPSEQPKYLIQLLRSILLNFLELVGILSLDAEVAKSKVEDLRTLFYNAHDQLNRYRPHQARESLISFMEGQLRHQREEVAGVQSRREMVNAYLNSLGSLEVSEPIMASTVPSGVAAERGRKQDQRRAWQALESIEV